MNNDQAKKGLKTFIILLAVFAIVAGAIYSSANVVSLEEETTKASVTNDSAFRELAEAQTPKAQVPAVLQAADENTITGTGDEEGTGDDLAVGEDPNYALVTDPTGDGTDGMNTPAAEESTTVPQTGTFGITISLVLSLLTLLGGMLFIRQNPRKLALSRFEKEISSKL